MVRRYFGISRREKVRGGSALASAAIGGRHVPYWGISYPCRCIQFPSARLIFFLGPNLPRAKTARVVDGGRWTPTLTRRGLCPLQLMTRIGLVIAYPTRLAGRSSWSWLLHRCSGMRRAVVEPGPGRFINWIAASLVPLVEADLLPPPLFPLLPSASNHALSRRIERRGSLVAIPPNTHSSILHTPLPYTKYPPL